MKNFRLTYKQCKEMDDMLNNYSSIETIATKLNISRALVLSEMKRCGLKQKFNYTTYQGKNPLIGLCKNCNNVKPNKDGVQMVEHAKGKTMSLRRHLYIEGVGNIPKNTDVLTNCGDNMCLNVEHMILMTKKEHMRSAKVELNYINCKSPHPSFITDCKMCTTTVTRKGKPIREFFYIERYGEYSHEHYEVKPACGNVLCMLPEHMKLVPKKKYRNSDFIFNPYALQDVNP